VSSNRNRTGVIEIGRKLLGSAGAAILGVSVGLPLHYTCCQRLTEHRGEWFGECRRAESQKPRRYLVNTSRCWSQCVRHPKQAHLGNVIIVMQIVGCRQFHHGCAVVGVCRDGRQYLPQLQRERDKSWKSTRMPVWLVTLKIWWR